MRCSHPRARSFSRLFLFAALLHTAAPATAVHLDVLGKRDHLNGLSNEGNLNYFANLTLNGTPFQVLVDTGSSDLWVAGNVPGAGSTGATASVQYAIGSASGPVKTATVDFLGYTVPNQAFIAVSPTTDNPNGKGLVGLGPNVGSRVHSALGNQDAGDAVIDNIFRLNTSSPNFLTILLTRDDDPNGSFPGEITVGDVIAGYEAVTSQNQVPVTSVSSKSSSGQHWQVLMDPDGFIGPDGKPVDYNTHVSSTKNKAQLTAIFDTGFSLPQVPSSVADGIYSRFEGAQFENNSVTGPVWTLPCETEVNITLLIGGASYPMHPLDTNMDLGFTRKDGTKFCVGSLQPITTAAASTFDVILGMSFLRNVYLLIDYGDFQADSPERTAPYVQLLSTTDPAIAHRDFVEARLGGVDSTGNQRLLDAPTLPTSDPSANTSGGGSPVGNWFKDHWVLLAIAGGSTVGGLTLLGVVLCCVRSRRGKTAYRPLHEPAPLAARDVGQVAGYGSAAELGAVAGAGAGAGAGVAGYAALAGSQPGHRRVSSLSMYDPPPYTGAADGTYAAKHHGRGVSDAGSLVWEGGSEHGGFDHDGFDSDKAPLAPASYPNPWDRTH